MKCRDHLGNEYATKSDMLTKYGMNYALFNSRMKRGWTLERALTEPADGSRTRYRTAGEEAKKETKKEELSVSKDDERKMRLNELNKAASVLCSEGRFGSAEYLQSYADYVETGDASYIKGSLHEDMEGMEQTLVKCERRGYSAEVKRIREIMAGIRNAEITTEVDLFTEYREGSIRLDQIGLRYAADVLKSKYLYMDRKKTEAVRYEDAFWKAAYRHYIRGDRCVDLFSDKVKAELEIMDKCYAC